MALRARNIAGVMLVVGPVAAFLIERVVVTDREAVTQLLEAAVGAVAAEDFVGLRDLLDEEFSADGRDRDAAARYVEEQVRRYRPTGLSADVREVAVERDRARASLRVRGRVMYGGWVDLEADLVRRPEGWRIASARQVSAGWRGR